MRGSFSEERRFYLYLKGFDSHADWELEKSLSDREDSINNKWIIKNKLQVSSLGNQVDSGTVKTKKILKRDTDFGGSTDFCSVLMWKFGGRQLEE